MSSRRVQACALAMAFALPSAAAPEKIPASARTVRVGGTSLAIASWDAAGAHRVALSRDGGRSFAPSEAMSYEIPLRAGPLDRHARAGTDDRLFIVQLETKGVAALRRVLREAGADLLAYLPKHAWIARMDPSVAAEVDALPFVRWVGPYLSRYKIDPELAPGGGAERTFVSAFRPGPKDKAAIAAAVRAAGGSVVRAIPDGYRLEAMLTAEQIAALARAPEVAWIDRFSPPETDLDRVRAQCGATHLASVAGFHGQGVRGEVMDCGIMASHPDHDGRIEHGPPPSGCDHGTAVYGIVFGNGDRDGDGEGMATGLLPEAQGYFYDYDELVNRYQATAELVSPAIRGVFQSNSWGGARTTSYTSTSHELDDIVWKNDLVVFQSQSNSGTRASRPEAWAKNVLSVGGVHHWDTPTLADDCWCSGASTGPAEDGRVKPDLVHWYDFVYATDADPGGYDDGLYTPAFSGTSASTPIVAGIGGLFFQMWAENVLGNDPVGVDVFERRPHAMTIKAMMINTADPYPFSGAASDLSRAKQGWGLPSASNLYDRRDRIRVIDEEHVLEENERHVYTAIVPGGEPSLRVTLAFMDRPGTLSSPLHRVNDLSLEVTSPAGTTYRGNVGLGDGIWSVPGGSADHVDTVENVFVPNPAAGTWKVRVIADDVQADVHLETPEDDQDYALVASGVAALTLDPSSSPGAISGPLVLGKSGSDLVLSWGADCGGGSAYSIYRGDLSAGYVSAAPVIGGCSVASTSATVPAGPASAFFLVAPNDGSLEGSLGSAHPEAERPQPEIVCRPRAPEVQACAP